MKGWYKESYRHYLASKGVKTSKRYMMPIIVYRKSQGGKHTGDETDANLQARYHKVALPTMRVARTEEEQLKAAINIIKKEDPDIERVSVTDKNDFMLLDYDAKTKTAGVSDDVKHIVKRYMAKREIFLREVGAKPDEFGVTELTDVNFATDDQLKDPTYERVVFIDGKLDRVIKQDKYGGGAGDSKKYMMAKWDSEGEKVVIMKNFERDAKVDVDNFIKHTTSRNSGSSRYRLDNIRHKYEGKMAVLKDTNLIDGNDWPKLDSALDSALDPGRNHIDNLRSVGKSEYSKYQEKAGIYAPRGKK